MTASTGQTIIPPMTAWFCSSCHRKFPEQHPRLVVGGGYGDWLCEECGLTEEKGYEPLLWKRPKPVKVDQPTLFGDELGV